MRTILQFWNVSRVGSAHQQVTYPPVLLGSSLVTADKKLDNTHACRQEGHASTL